jgi:GNAT superfamily N-acetyltransferase
VATLQNVVVTVAEVRPVSGDLWPVLADLFGRGGASNGCRCMYWILGPEYHKRPRERNKQALRRAAVHGPAPGLLALDHTGVALGWCRLTPRAELAWLTSNGELAPVDDVAVWSLPCFFVRRAVRRQGVMASLIAGAVEHARASGAPAIEAYPIDTSVRGSTRNVFPGTFDALTKAGFTEIARMRPERPIMRYDLSIG